MTDSDKSRKVFILASTLVTGGAEVIVRTLAERLPTELFDVEIICLRGPGIIGRKLHSKGYKVGWGVSRGRFDPFSYFKLANRFRGAERGILFSLDHHNALFWGALASKAAGISGRIISAHSTGLWGGRRSFGLTDRMVMPLYDRIVALSSKHADYLCEVEGVRREKIKIINNGVDTEKYKPAASAGEKKNFKKALSVPEDGVVVTMVAALRPEKNHGMLIEAASMISKIRKDIYFLIVGDGEERMGLETLVLEKSLGERVFILGGRDDIPKILKGTDISVLCSYPVVETFPLTILEAMSSGLPVISTDVGSISEIIRNGRDGLLIRSEKVEELANAITRLAGDRQERLEMGTSARKRVKDNFSAGIMLDKYMNLFDSLSE